MFAGRRMPPVNGRVFVKRVCNAQCDGVAFLQRRVGAGTDPLTVNDLRRAREVHRGFANAQIKVRSGECSPRCRRVALSPGGLSPEAQTCGSGSESQPFDEGSS